MKRFLTASCALIILSACTQADAPEAQAQDAKPAPKVTTTDLGGGLYMLVGRGGNVGVSIGEDGVIVIDDQFADMAAPLLEAIGQLTDKPVRFMINTHHHGDHTGGNEEFVKSGATIIAHDNVHKRLSTEQYNKVFDRTTPAKPKAFHPTLSYQTRTTFHMNGQHAKAVYAPGHTDGDTIIYFDEANVLHMGDNFFHNMFPFIDTGSGGSIDGMIAAHETALGMINADTKIIPGHGPLARKTDLKAAQDLLKDIKARIGKHVDAGDSLEATLAANPLAGLEAYNGFMDTVKVTTIVHGDLSSK